MTNVLDAANARIMNIRAMAGRAMLDGPHDYRAEDLEGPLLDLAVAKATGVPAVIHKVNNAVAPFFECCVLSEDGRLHYQFTPSCCWSQGGPLVEEHGISIIDRGNGRWAAGLQSGLMVEANSPLLAAMRALVREQLGATVQM